MPQWIQMCVLNISIMQFIHSFLLFFQVHFIVATSTVYFRMMSLLDLTILLVKFIISEKKIPNLSVPAQQQRMEK
jgi:hypothetical protein